MYGGHDGSNDRGGLYKLSSGKWSQLSDESDVNSPIKKNGCGMVCFNKKKVAVIGGYGLLPASLQPGASFIKDKCYSDGEGWTNEIHIFDTDECELLYLYTVTVSISSMHPQVSGPPLPSVVLDLLSILFSLSPALMTTGLSCVEDMMGNIKRQPLKSTLLTSRHWYNNNACTQYSGKVFMVH